ncbi:MAG TPA: NADPH:quinone oxidoreductase family protein [Acidimicrobiales bacterium]|nr:NADPH:quinone oxidoreductase family protein [Acidimicrobiales bacterium]
MRAVRCERYGPPDSVVVAEVDDPVAGEGQVVVDVAAAAVNFPDVLVVADRYQVTIPVPFTVGSEFAGTVSSLGSGVEGLVVGDRVKGSVLFGAFADRVAVSAAALEPVDPAIDLVSAAASGVAHRTAFHALHTFARVQPDQWVVVLGAAGGVGLAAVELATVFGAKVVAAASTAEKLALCRDRGAVAGIDYTTEDLKERTKELTGGGADVVIDPVGGPAAEAALRALRWGGRFVTVGFASGEIPRIPLNLVLLKGVIVTGFTLGGFSQNQPADYARDLAELGELYRSGRFTPHISARYPLDRAGQALDDLAQRRALGKVVVVP